jgi:excisionase family DNA binding protein
MISQRPRYELMDGEFLAYIPPRIAALIESRTNIRRLRVGLRGIDPEATAVLESLRECASSWRGFPGTETVMDSPRKPATRSTWLTTGQAAAVTGISRQAIGKAIRTGRLPATRVDGRYRVSRQDLEQWLATRPNG